MKQYVILTKKNAKTSTIRLKPENHDGSKYEHSFEFELPDEVEFPEKTRTKKPINTFNDVKELFEEILGINK